MSKNLYSFFNMSFLLLAFIADTLVKYFNKLVTHNNVLITIIILGIFLVVNAVFSIKLFKNIKSFGIGILILIAVGALLYFVSTLLIPYNLGDKTVIVSLLVSIVMSAIVGHFLVPRLKK